MEILAVLTLLFGYAVMRHLDAQKNRDRQHPVGRQRPGLGGHDPIRGQGNRWGAAVDDHADVAVVELQRPRGSIRHPHQPTPAEAVVPAYLDRFRRGGGKRQPLRTA